MSWQPHWPRGHVPMGMPTPSQFFTWTTALILGTALSMAVVVLEDGLPSAPAPASADSSFMLTASQAPWLVMRVGQEAFLGSNGGHDHAHLSLFRSAGDVKEHCDPAIASNRGTFSEAPGERVKITDIEPMPSHYGRASNPCGPPFTVRVVAADGSWSGYVSAPYVGLVPVFPAGTRVRLTSHAVRARPVVVRAGPSADAGRRFRVPVGTAAAVIGQDESVVGQAGQDLHVRITAGPHRGRAGWVRMWDTDASWLRPADAP